MAWGYPGEEQTEVAPWRPTERSASIRPRRRGCALRARAPQRQRRQLARTRGLAAAALAAALVLVARPGPPWLLLGRPRDALAARTSRRKPSPEEPKDWFYIDDSTATFGSVSELDVRLAGPVDMARSYLLGDDAEGDSVERLLHAARPLGAEVRRVPTCKRSEAEKSSVQRYSLSLPKLRLLGLGTAEASVSVWGAIRDKGGPQAGGGPYMEIGSDEGLQVALQVRGAGDVSPSRIGLDLRGAFGVDENQEGGPRIVGWIKLEIQGRVPSFAGFSAPESVLRPAAREAMRQTLGFTTRRLGQDLASDFAQWVRSRER